MSREIANRKSKYLVIVNRKWRIAIVGAGPAGSSLAIRLAQRGFETVLVERERFPRQKLCGEFISPECFSHFEALGVLENMLDAGGDRINETRFFETGGRSIVVPTGWFGHGDFALSLSRASMDHKLLERAIQVGVEVLDGTSITALEIEGGRVVRITGRSDDGRPVEIGADLFVDATGRAGVLRRLSTRVNGARSKGVDRPTIVGFKAHLADPQLETGACEIYSFPGGYAGLSNVENGRANLCFMVRAELVRSVGNDASTIVNDCVRRNRRASETLRSISDADWLAVAITGFGTKSVAPLANLLSIGDAASFIDPFTGSGMVMALESSAVLAEVVLEHHQSPAELAGEYRTAYRSRFSSRLRICSVLRRTAFMPRLATLAVASLGASSAVRRHLARATRG